MKILLSSLVLFSSLNAFAGAAQVELSCKSASGKTRLEATLPGDMDFAAIKVTLDATSKPTTVTLINQGMIDHLEMNGHSPKEIYPNHQVREVATRDQMPTTFGFSVLSFNTDARILNLSAFRKSVKAKETNSGTRATFQAELTMDDPRPNAAKPVLSGVVLNCSYVYEI